MIFFFVLPPHFCAMLLQQLPDSPMMPWLQHSLGSVTLSSPCPSLSMDRSFDKLLLVPGYLYILVSLNSAYILVNSPFSKLFSGNCFHQAPALIYFLSSSLLNFLKAWKWPILPNRYKIKQASGRLSHKLDGEILQLCFQHCSGERDLNVADTCPYYVYQRQFIGLFLPLE